MECALVLLKGGDDMEDIDYDFLEDLLGLDDEFTLSDYLDSWDPE